MKGIVRLVSLAALLAVSFIPPQAAFAQPQPATVASQSCQLNNGIKHVVSIVFDNTHLFRDRAGVPSDLQQMPNLLNFMTNNGTLSDNEHTILISHTAGGILSSLTGLYPDRMGINVSNSYAYYSAVDGSVRFSSAFKYWTDLVDANTGVTDPLPNMVTTGGKTTPAPWVPYTRAGCDFGAVSTANVVLENTGTGKNGDITKVFGNPSVQWTEADLSNKAAGGTAARALAQTDFVGIAIHCGQGGGICNGATGSRPDSLPDEPGGYANFQGLFGAKYVNPAIAGGPVVNDTNGQPIQDPFHQNGFPGFDGMSAARSLGYVAKMQEAGVPVTFAYISDAHDNHSLFRASGPGEADYKAQLADYNKAFGDFFTRLAGDGINKSNTLFVFTSDENDHFAGGNSTNGIWSHSFCNVTLGQTCPANQIGEVTQNLSALAPAGSPAFDIHFDSAPTVYVHGNPIRTNADLRNLERGLAAATAVDPYISSTPKPITLYMADAVEQKALHMMNADPLRTPSFTLFGNPDNFFTTGDTACPTVTVPTCVDYHFAWSHGDATNDIGRTWLGIVGPGVKHLGRTSRTWSDHTDIQPTVLSLLGLKDSYTPDGAVLTDFLKTSEDGQHDGSTSQLRSVYKQITAPFGPFAHNTLVASTRGIASGSAANDGQYAATEAQISTLTSSRDALAEQMRTALTVAAFGGGEGAGEQDFENMISKGKALLAKASALAQNDQNDQGHNS
jgi:hypothetical protein